jgi:hypothetical protein
LKPPEVSSFRPPGACITPSREIIDRTVIFLMLFLLCYDANVIKKAGRIVV